MNTKELSVTDAVKTFSSEMGTPVRALNSVNLTIPTGSHVAIMGPSGSGKSTLLHCMSGILPLDEENVAMPLLLAGMSLPSALPHAREWLVRLGLADAARRRPGQISGGQAQRVAIARAMVASPAVVFADEPTGALDQNTGAQVMQLLTQACTSTGATLVLVTHDDAIAAWCPRLVTMRDGNIVADQMRVAK